MQLARGKILLYNTKIRLLSSIYMLLSDPSFRNSTINEQIRYAAKTRRTATDWILCVPLRDESYVGSCSDRLPAQRTLRASMSFAFNLSSNFPAPEDLLNPMPMLSRALSPLTLRELCASQIGDMIPCHQRGKINFTVRISSC